MGKFVEECQKDKPRDMVSKICLAESSVGSDQPHSDAPKPGESFIGFV